MKSSALKSWILWVSTALLVTGGLLASQALENWRKLNSDSDRVAHLNQRIASLPLLDVANRSPKEGQPPTYQDRKAAIDDLISRVTTAGKAHSIRGKAPNIRWFAAEHGLSIAKMTITGTAEADKLRRFLWSLKRTGAIHQVESLAIRTRKRNRYSSIEFTVTSQTVLFVRARDG